MSVNNFLKSKWNQGLIVLGIIGLLFFIYAHPHHYPDAPASGRIGNAQALDLTRAYLNEIGYEPFDAEANIRFTRDNDLSKQLQHQLGRRAYNRLYKSEFRDELPVMQWSVQHDNLRDLVIGGNTSNASWDVNMGITLSPGGKVIGFTSDNPDSLIQRFNPDNFNGSVTRLSRNAEGTDDYPDPGVLPANEGQADADEQTDAGRSAGSGVLPDSDEQSRSEESAFFGNFTNEQLLDMVSFDLKQEREPAVILYDADQERFTIGHDILEQMVEAHLLKTNWQPGSFRIDSMYVIPGRTSRQARIHLDSIEPVLDHNIRLSMDIAASGQLISLEYDAIALNPRPEAKGEQLWSGITGIGYVLTGLIAFIVFIRRFTLRLIDSKSALPDTLLGALVVASVVMISAFNEVTQYGVAETRVIVGMLIGTFFLAAMGGILFFILSSTSVSISYGVMPEKIRSLNLARSGYMFNTPIGIALLQGVFVSGIILGLYSLYLSAFPHAVYHYESITPFTTFFLFGKTLSSLVYSLLIAIFLTYSLFLILGSMIYGEKHRLIWYFLAIITFWILSFPLNPGLASPALGIMSAAITGAVMAIVYLRYDALTVVTSLFVSGFMISLYENYLMQAPNWQAETGMSIILLSGLVATGIAGLYSQKSGDELPSFVPAYIFEHANRQRMHRELEIARQVQLSFLPNKIPEFASLDMAANCRAASEVGGDYYDFINLDDHRMAVVIGDVSGKGIQAAFYMTLVKGFIQSLSYDTSEPAAFLSKLNFLFCKNVTRGTFVSLIFGIIDTQNDTFTFARAGHNPIIYNAVSNGKSVMLNTSGLAIGMVSDERFEQNIEVQTIRLKKGDTLVLYTDGYSEAMDPAKNLYGEEKLMSIIDKNSIARAEELLVAINKDVNRFAGFADQHDDMTMVIIRYTGQESGFPVSISDENQAAD